MLPPQVGEGEIGRKQTGKGWKKGRLTEKAALWVWEEEEIGQGLAVEDERQSLFLLKVSARESSGQGLQKSQRRAPSLLSPSVLFSIFLADSSTSTCSSTLTFHLSTLPSRHLYHARLWLHVLPALPGTLYLRIFRWSPRRRRRGSRTLLAEHQITGPGWHALTLPSSGLRGEEPRFLKLQLDCRRLEGNSTNAQQPQWLLDTVGDQRPFLELKIQPNEPGAGRAKRRTLTCEPETPLCCRRDHYVDFQELGWQDWILQPEGYQLNYCSGQCPPHLAGSPGIAASFHSAVFSLLKANNPWPLGTSCCVPTARRPLSLLYLDRNGNVVKTDVPDMVVEACGCS